MMNRPPKRPKGPAQKPAMGFAGPNQGGDPAAMRTAMGLKLNGPPSHRKRKPTR
jgi:hypothetical protein